MPQLVPSSQFVKKEKRNDLWIWNKSSCVKIGLEGKLKTCE